LSVIERFTANPVAVLFLIIAAGYSLGALRFKGVSLGSSAVLFVALVFGHLKLSVPHVIADLGVILFVYAVGLQAGPRFFSTFQRQGLSIIQIGLGAVISAAAMAYLMGWLLNLPVPLRVGMFAGAMTSTPALAAALDTLSDPLISVGYGLAYPFGVVGVVLFVQLVPRLLRSRFQGSSAPNETGSSPAEEAITTRKFLIQNPQCEGKSLGDIRLHGMADVNISRIKRGNRVITAKWESLLQVGDVVLAVGTPADLGKMEVILGPETDQEIPLSRDVVTREVYVSEHRAAGKTLAELNISQRFGVIVTRLDREDIEVVPTGKMRLEIGDLLRIVGSPEDCETFVEFIGRHEKRIHETPILPFAIGISLGILLAYFPLMLPGGITVRLGLAGGPLLVALVLSYYGRVGHFRMRTPYAARFLLRELGLVFFLAGAGTEAGAHFLEVLRDQGITIVFAGALVTATPIAVAFLLTWFVFHFDLNSCLGTVCGAKTSTPGLGAACAVVESDEPALAYAAIYPVALIAITAAAQILASGF